MGRDKRVHHNVNSTEHNSCRLHYIDHNSNFPFHAKHASTHHGIDPIISQYSSFVSIYSIKQMVQFCQLKRDERIEW